MLKNAILACLLGAALLQGCKTAIPQSYTGDTAPRQAMPSSGKKDNTAATAPNGQRGLQGDVAVKIQVGTKAAGSGFCITTSNKKLQNYSVIVTAAHNLATVPYGSSSTISVANQKTVPVKVIKHFLDEKKDIAILITDKLFREIPVNTSPSPTETCTSYNYSFIPAMPKDSIILSKGYILEISNSEIWAYLLPFEKGGSGSPLLCNNSIVGMINSKALNEEKQPTGVVHAVNIKDILYFIDTIK